MNLLDNFFVFVIVVLGGVALFIGAIALGGRQVAHHYAIAECNSFERATTRPTTFVDYTYWSWDCLTPSADGKLISVKALRDFTEGRP